MKKTVGDILQSKGHDIWSIGPDASVYQAIEKMAEKGVGALLVIDQGQMVGILSERDYTRKVILRGRSSMTTAVKEIMTSEVITVRHDQTADECMQIVTERRVRHLPVFKGTRLIGMISIGDIGKAIICEQQFIIEQLKEGWPTVKG